LGSLGKRLFSSEGKYVGCPWLLLNGVDCLVGRKMSWFGEKLSCEKVCFGDAFVYGVSLKTGSKANLGCFLTVFCHIQCNIWGANV
jgi:hypothetical protein